MATFWSSSWKVNGGSTLPLTRNTKSPRIAGVFLVSFPPSLANSVVATWSWRRALPSMMYMLRFPSSDPFSTLPVDDSSISHRHRNTISPSGRRVTDSTHQRRPAKWFAAVTHVQALTGQYVPGEGVGAAAFRSEQADEPQRRTRMARTPRDKADIDPAARVRGCGDRSALLAMVCLSCIEEYSLPRKGGNRSPSVVWLGDSAMGRLIPSPVAAHRVRLVTTLPAPRP